MGTVYVFFADGFEEIEAFTSVDVMRRAGLNVEMVTVTPDEIVTGAHDVPVLCDKNVVNCDFFDAELVLLPGGMPNLGGRSLGEGGLPRPVYNVQDEGRVVVTITVNPAGHVIATSINRQTNTVNPALRKAAEDAAKKARFNAVSGLNNQTGTITYYFNLK